MSYHILLGYTSIYQLGWGRHRAFGAWPNEGLYKMSQRGRVLTSIGCSHPGCLQNDWLLASCILLELSAKNLEDFLREMLGFEWEKGL